MGLDSIIQYYNGEKFTCELPIEIGEKFQSVISYGIIGIDKLKKYDNYYFLSFRGKAYAKTINRLTGLSLYADLESKELKIICEKLENIIENHDYFFEEDQIEKAYTDAYNLTDWLEFITDQYVPSPKEIIGLAELFRICYENKLQVYACC